MAITFDLLYRFQENKVFQTAQTMNKLYSDTDFVSCSSKTTHDSYPLFWELHGRQSLIKDNTQLDRKFEYIMYDLRR